MTRRGLRPRGFALDPSVKLWLPFYAYGLEQAKIYDQSGNNNHGTIVGAVPGTYGLMGPVELMPNQVDRDFSGASAWTNVDLNAYNETTDLTITANAADQYCTCPVASMPTTIGKRYRLYYDLANIVESWTVKSFDGTQTIGTISANATQGYLDWVASTTGGLRLVAVANTSSGDFDNFSLKEITGYSSLGWYFDGVNDLVNNASPSVSLSSGTITLISQFMILGNGTTANNNVMLIALTDGYDHMFIGWNNSTLKFASRMNFQIPDASTQLQSLTSLSTNVWYCAGLTYDKINIILYLNGVQDNIVAVTKTLRNDVSAIGSGGLSLGLRYFNGLIVQNLIINSAWSAQDHRNFYELTRHIVGA